MKFFPGKRFTNITTRILSGVGLLLSGFAVAAVPELQLGIGNGYYDGATETIVTASRHFVLNAYADKAVDLDTPCNLTITVVPDRGLDPEKFGTFHFNGQKITVADMVFGEPPPGNDPAVIDDRGLQKFGLTKAWYFRQAFRFNPAQLTPQVDTRTAPQYMPVATIHDEGGSYVHYQSFGVSALGLKEGYNLHFALYSGDEGDLAGAGTVRRYAPFTHDAATDYVAPRVPAPLATSPPAGSISEPGILLLAVLALGGLAYSQKRRRTASITTPAVADRRTIQE